MKGFIKWALFILIVNAVLSIVGYLTMDEQAMSTGEGGGMGQLLYWLGMLVGIALLFMGIRERKMENPSDFTYGRGFTQGLLISVFAGLFVGAFAYVFYSFVAGDMIDLIREGSFTAMEKQGTTPEQMEQARPWMEFFISPTGFFIWTLVIYSFFGLILSLIFAAIVNAMGPKSGGAEPVTA